MRSGRFGCYVYQEAEPVDLNRVLIASPPTLPPKKHGDDNCTARNQGSRSSEIMWHRVDHHRGFGYDTLRRRHGAPGKSDSYEDRTKEQ